MNQMIPSFVFKHRGWEAIKPWMQVLVVVGLRVMLPGLLNTMTQNLLQDDLEAAISGPVAELAEFSVRPLPEGVTADRITPELQESMAEELATHLDALVSAFMGFMRDKGWIMLVTIGLEALLTPVLMAPLYGSLLDVHRRRELTLPGALAHLRRSPKMLLLELWAALRVYAWMLPGMAAMFAGVLLPEPVGSLLMIVGSVAAIVLCVRATLHYILSPIALMDQPGLSLNGCIRASWNVMRTRKMEYFMLRISFMGWVLLVYLINTLAVGTVMTVICMTLTMVADMLLTLYINSAVVSFWDAYGVRRETPDEAAARDAQASPESDELN